MGENKRDRFDEIARDLFHDVLATAQEERCVAMIVGALQDAYALKRRELLDVLNGWKERCETAQRERDYWRGAVDLAHAHTRDAVASAVAAEREACAAIADARVAIYAKDADHDEYDRGGFRVATNIAMAIRGRSA